MSKMLLVLFVSSVHMKGCYWNHPYPYTYFGTKTPYEAVRGDIRDYKSPDYCEPVSLWILSRHGNRYPSLSTTTRIKEVLSLRDEIFDGFKEGITEVCGQDIENFKRWSWNKTLEYNQNDLSDTGYNEMSNLGKRIRHRYGNLLHGTADEFYFRPTNLLRTRTSCEAFVEALIHGNNINVTMADALLIDNVIRPYEKCDRYQKFVKGGSLLTQQLSMFFFTPEYKSLEQGITRRLGLKNKLNGRTIFSMYDMCRFYRSWADNLRDPWCAFFSDDDLMLLEYYDDVGHYYKNGYGAKINIELGKAPLRDLYQRFQDVVHGKGRKITGYFGHDTIIEMASCALGLHRDEDLSSVYKDPMRRWRTSFFGAFSANMIAVLYKYNEPGKRLDYRVQIFINERITPVCPAQGCTWKEFHQIFHVFNRLDLKICSLAI